MIARLKSILNNNLYAMSLYSRQIAGTCILFVIARYLSVYDYGIFSSYKTIATFILMFANLGFAEYILVSSKNNVREIQLKIGLFVLMALCYTALIAIVSCFFPIESKWIFILVLLRCFFDSTFFAIMLPYFQASKKFNIISSINIFYSITTIIIAIISYILQLSLVKFLLLSIFLGLFNFVQMTFFTKINYLISIRYIKRILKKIDDSIFQYVWVMICSYFYAQLPSIFISLFVVKTKAALYFAAFTIASVINILLTAQVQKIMPELINKSTVLVKQLIKQNLKTILILNFLVLAFFTFGGKFLLKLLYSKQYYVSAYPILLILSLANVSIAIAAIYGAYITASGNQHIKIKMQIEAIIICIITLLLFYKLGIYAATLAYLLSATHIGIRYVIKTKQLLKQETIKESTCNR
jgi:PST family polysaccharide transporter